MKYGYARETGDHDLALQLSELEADGCQSVITENKKGFRELNGLMTRLDKGDSLVVWRIDKLADSLTELNGRVEELQKVGVNLCSVLEKFDSSKDSGITKAIISQLAELEK